MLRVRLTTRNAKATAKEEADSSAALWNDSQKSKNKCKGKGECQCRERERFG
jgi:hypothetical protein